MARAKTRQLQARAAARGRAFALLRLSVLWLLAAACLAPAANADTPSDIISTVVGNGLGSGFGGDGAPAVNASVNDLQGVAVAPDGRLYIVDAANNRIRTVSPDGVISTVAGNGTRGYTGDGGPAVKAELNDPTGVTLAPDGALYISDMDNNVVRKVAADGTISTYVGNGTAGDSGDGGPATAAEINTSESTALGPDGGLYIGDFRCNCIRRVSPGGTISTFVSGIGTPLGLAFDSAGNLYVAAVTDNRLYKIAPDGTSSVLAGTGVQGYSGDGGPATAAELSNPHGLAVGPDGSVYFSDRGNSRIRVVSPNGIISTFAGDGSTGFAGDGGPATAAEVHYVEAIAMGSTGNLYIADALNNRIREIASGLDVHILAPTMQATTTDTATTVSYVEQAEAATPETSCTLDGKPVACSPTSASLTGLSLGAHTFTVTAAAMLATSTAGVSWTVIAPPQVHVTSPLNATSTASTSQTVTYDEFAGGAASGTACRLDDKPVACSATSARLTGLGLGAQTFAVTVSDMAGQTATASVSWTVIAPAPQMSLVRATLSRHTLTVTLRCHASKFCTVLVGLGRVGGRAGAHELATRTVRVRAGTKLTVRVGLSRAASAAAHGAGKVLLTVCESDGQARTTIAAQTLTLPARSRSPSGTSTGGG